MISGFGWSGVAQSGRQVLKLVFGLILVRLLTPRAFGLYGMTLVFLGFAEIFQEMGMTAALIHKQVSGQKYYSSAFWVNLAAGLLLTGAFVGAAPYIAGFYGEAELTPLAMCLAISFLIDATTVVQRSILRKKLDFRTLSIIDLCTVLVAGATSITLAYLGMGVWALVALLLTRRFASAVLLWLVSEWRPAFVFSPAAVGELLGFSVYLVGAKSMNYWVRKLDDLLVGRFIGSRALGIYGRAYEIMLLPLQSVSRVLADVMFPSFSAIQHDKKRVKRIYLRCTRAIGLVTFPMMLGLLVTAGPFVRGLLGLRWEAMIPILRVFCVLGVTQSVGTLNGTLYQSQGRTDLQFRVGLIVKTVLILGIVIGLQWGVLGVAVGYGIASLSMHFLTVPVAISVIEMRYRTFATNLAPVLVTAVCMAGVVWVIGLFLPRTWHELAALGGQITAGGIIYFVLLQILRPEAYLDVRGTLAEHFESRCPLLAAILRV